MMKIITKNKCTRKKSIVNDRVPANTEKHTSSVTVCTEYAAYAYRNEKEHIKNTKENNGNMIKVDQNGDGRKASDPSKPRGTSCQCDDIQKWKRKERNKNTEDHAWQHSVVAARCGRAKLI